MEVYFVRHGQTDGNVARRHQHPDTELNEVGVAQAEAVASEIRKLKPTHIITSTQLRAVQTTKIIDAYCEDIIPETHNEFEELKRPDFLVGNRYAGLVTLWYVWRWFWGKLTEGGETYLGFLGRIREARKLLETYPDNSKIVVVSHAVFMNIFIEHMCSDKPMSLWRAARRFWFVLTIRNASIIHLQFEKRGTGICRWRYISSTSVHPRS